MTSFHPITRLSSLVLVSLLTIPCLFTLFGGDLNANAAPIPSTINTDWTVSSFLEYNGGSCILSGNITIQNGGNLTLRNLTLAFNNKIDGHYKITVNNGGALNIFNSTIKSNTKFRTSKLESMGSLYVTDSTLRDFGPNSGFNGISSMAGKAIFKKTTITNNSIGYQAMWVNPVIEDCTFININYRGFYLFEASATLKRVRFINASAGIGTGALYASANTRISLFDSEISNTSGNALMVDDGRIEIYNTTFNNNTNDFYIWRSAPVHIFINTTNTTFKKITWFGAGGQALFTVYWYVNVSSFWESDHSSIPGSELVIRDKNSQSLFSGLLDGNGRLNLLRIKEREEASGSKTAFTPHTFNLTGQRGLLNRTNQTAVSITKSLDLPIGLDDLSPTLQITSPVEGSMTNKTKVQVEGITEPGCLVWVNGTITTVGTGGAFTSEFTLGHEGTTKISVKARDPFGNEKEAWVNVTLDKTPPNLTLDGPKEGDLFNSTSVSVFGTADVGANLIINNEVTTITNDGKYTKTLTVVEGKNQVNVVCLDSLNNKASISINIYVDLTAPSIVITEPGDGFRTNSTSIVVSGLTELESNVTVNSVYVPVFGPNYQTNVTLSEGENTILVRSCDKVMNCNETSIHVTRDTMPPILEVTSPSVGDWSLTNKHNITIVGRTDQDATLFIAEELVQLSSGGAFSHSFNLSEGKNIISIRAVDDVGNHLELTCLVIRDSTPPSLSIIEPKKVLRTSEPSVIIKGQVELNSTVTIDGTSVPLTGDVFEKSVTLNTEGKNEFNFTAWDLAGNSKTVSVTIIRDTQINLIMDSPLDGLRTKNETIMIKGTTDPGVTLTINNELAIPDQKGSFQKEITLTIGENLLVVKVIDDVGNEKVSSVTVIREKKADKPKPLLGGLFLPIVIGIVVALLVVVGVVLKMRKKPRAPQPESTPPPQQITPAPPPQWASVQTPPEGQPLPQQPNGEPPQWPNPPTQ